MIKKSIGTAVWIGIRTICSFAINKLISLSYGPSGLTILAQLQNITALFLGLTQDGISQGAIKYWSSTAMEKEKSKVFSAALLLHVLIFIAILIFLGLFKNYLLHFFQVEQPTLWIVLFAVAFCLLLGNYFMLSMLLAWNELKAYLLLQCFGSLAGVAVVYLLIHTQQLAFVVMGAALGHSVSSFFTLFYFWTRKQAKGLFRFHLQWGTYRLLLKYVVMAVGIIVFGKISDLLLRQYVINLFSFEETGIWQAVVKFSDYYTAAFTSMLMVIYFPKVSSFSTNPVLLRTYVLKMARWFSPFICIGLLCTYLYKTELLVIFFTEEFAKGAPLLAYVIYADLIKLHAFLLAYLLNAQARTTLFLICEAFSTVLYVALSLFLTKEIGVQGLVIANLIRYAAYALLLLLIYFRLLFPVSKNQLLK